MFARNHNNTNKFKKEIWIGILNKNILTSWLLSLSRFVLSMVADSSTQTTGKNITWLNHFYKNVGPILCIAIQHDACDQVVLKMYIYKFWCCCVFRGLILFMSHLLQTFNKKKMLNKYYSTRNRNWASEIYVLHLSLWQGPQLSSFIIVAYTFTDDTPKISVKSTERLRNQLYSGKVCWDPVSLPPLIR